MPRVTEVFWNSMFVRSPRVTSEEANAMVSLGIGALSPVSAASCASSVADRTIRPSAGHDVTGLDLDEVAGNDLGGRDQRDRSVPDHPRLRHLHLGQRVHARPRGQLLAGAQRDVEDDEEADDDPGRDLPDEQADDHHRDQHQVHRVPQLNSGDLHRRRRFLGGDPVRAV